MSDDKETPGPFDLWLEEVRSSEGPFFAIDRPFQRSGEPFFGLARDVKPTRFSRPSVRRSRLAHLWAFLTVLPWALVASLKTVWQETTWGD